MGVSVKFTGDSRKVDFSKATDFTIKYKHYYYQYVTGKEEVERWTETDKVFTGKGNFIQISPNGQIFLYSIDKTQPIVVTGHEKNYIRGTTSEYDIDITNSWQSSLSFSQINQGGDRTFTDLLGITSTIYTNWLNNLGITLDYSILNTTIGSPNYFAYATGTPPLNKEDLDRIEIEWEIECNLPIFFTYECCTMFGYPSLGYESVGTDKEINWQIFTKEDIPNCIDGGTHQEPRHYALAYMIYDLEQYGDAPKPKPFFVENVATKIKYDGTKKASLIISHHFNLEEYQEFAEPTEVYKIPGYFINLAVNIRTVDPISGDNVNVYNLHKIDLPRDGFTKIAEVNDKGISKDYTYTYGDLVKACNNTVLSSPMKISVNIVQFADAVDGEPYVIYESPITDEIEINRVQHLYDGDTPASGIVNSIEWSGYDGSDDGDNSGGDGKNDDKGDKSGTTGSGQGTHNVLTTTYVSNATRLQALGDFLWSSSFLDNILLVNNNPIENVISVKMFPFTLPTGAESTIVLGNVDTEVPTNKLPDSYNYYHVYGSITVPSYYNNFMDYAPYTRILLYLPFYGTLELDNSLVIDRTLKIAYIVDVVTGACTIDVYANDSLITVVSCQVGIDIPISSSNRAQVESAILTNTLTSAVSGATVGGVVGAVGGGVGGALMSAGHCKYNTQTSGTPSSATELYNVSVPMLIIDRPKYREISGFAHNKGKMCMLTKKLSDVNGFSIFDRNIDLSGIGCTEAEMEMIRNLLSTGVYL